MHRPVRVPHLPQQSERDGAARYGGRGATAPRLHRWRPLRRILRGDLDRGQLHLHRGGGRAQPFQIARTQDSRRNFFQTIQTDVDAGRVAFTGLDKKRRLFGQPEWIANADISFDQPDWGTKATLSIFAISEVLDAVGAADLSNEGGVEGFTLDRYLDKYYQLDFVMSQAFSIPRVPGEFTAKASIKNLTDTTRKVIYDQEQTIDDIPERCFKIGRDYSFSIGYTLTY